MFGNMLLLWSIQLIEMSKAIVIFWTNPLIIALISYVVINERLTKYDIIGITCAFLGVVLF